MGPAGVNAVFIIPSPAQGRGARLSARGPGTPELQRRKFFRLGKGLGAPSYTPFSHSLGLDLVKGGFGLLSGWGASGHRGAPGARPLGEAPSGNPGPARLPPGLPLGRW